MRNISVELESMFLRLSNQYSVPDLSAQALLLPAIEAHIRKDLIDTYHLS